MKKFPIGFKITSDAENTENVVESTAVDSIQPKKSVVRVYFPDRNMTLSYYNDLFDLHEGDIVYVDGKLEGLRGRVVDVTYSFKIRLSDYKRVIAVADTNISGELYFAGTHILAFDRRVIPFEKVASWFGAPSADEEYVVGDGNEAFPLDDFCRMNFSREVAERGNEYYVENRVCYISVDKTSGKAIVNGSENYIVEFTYNNGEISNLVCSCFCTFDCKHEFAAMLQLKDCLKAITDEYSGKHDDYFAALSKDAFINYVLSNKQKGKFIVV